MFGTATNTTISAGGKEILGNFDLGATASNTVINGGEQDVGLSSTASYTTINMGGIQRVAGIYLHDAPGPGRADHTIVNNGAEQDVDTGIVTSTTVNAGGVQNLTNGGFASGTIVHSGGVINASGETLYHSPGPHTAPSSEAKSILRLSTAAPNCTCSGGDRQESHHQWWCDDGFGIRCRPHERPKRTGGRCQCGERDDPQFRKHLRLGRWHRHLHDSERRHA
ncbi:hypothetical protein ACQ5SK_14970 [Bradyrhizobium japonicum]